MTKRIEYFIADGHTYQLPKAGNPYSYSADAFGSFGALSGNIFADEVNYDRDWIDESRRYYTNIVGKYGTQVQTLLKKAESIEISMICPLHGHIWRQNINYILNKYCLF